MDFTALRYFCETARSRSIRTASERLHVSPSAISRQIAKLEHEVRAPLFDRRAQGMTPTQAGEILLTKVDGMVREFARVKSHIADLQNLQAGTVDVYGFQIAAENFVAPVVHEFHLRCPNVLINFTISSTDETIAALTKGTAEIGLVINPPIREAITNIEISRDTIVAVAGPAHPLARRPAASLPAVPLPALSLRDIAAFPFVLMESSFGLRQQIDRAFARYGIDPEVSCVTNSLNLVKGIASLGSLCTLLPRIAIEKEVAAGSLCSVAVTELEADPLVYCVCVSRGRQLSPAAKAFETALVDFGRQLG